MQISHNRRFISLTAGAFAGLCVDLSLFPLDTIKTRLQSGIGFKLSGGFRSLYAGVPSVIVGSAPSSALFFWSYETAKRFATPKDFYFVAYNESK